MQVLSFFYKNIITPAGVRCINTKCFNFYFGFFIRTFLMRSGCCFRGVSINYRLSGGGGGGKGWGWWRGGGGFFFFWLRLGWIIGGVFVFNPALVTNNKH